MSHTHHHPPSSLATHLPALAPTSTPKLVRLPPHVALVWGGQGGCQGHTSNIMGPQVPHASPGTPLGLGQPLGLPCTPNPTLHQVYLPNLVAKWGGTSGERFPPGPMRCPKPTNPASTSTSSIGKQITPKIPHFSAPQACNTSTFLV